MYILSKNMNQKNIRRAYRKYRSVTIILNKCQFINKMQFSSFQNKCFSHPHPTSISNEKSVLYSFFKIPTKNIEGQMTPYYPVGMGNGTPCSLKQNRPRSSTVMYICHPESKHEILSVAEVTTCEYEVVILTPLLCNHPKYRQDVDLIF